MAPRWNVDQSQTPLLYGHGSHSHFPVSGKLQNSTLLYKIRENFLTRESANEHGDPKRACTVHTTKTYLEGMFTMKILSALVG
jgi:hypothetical protein